MAAFPSTLDLLLLFVMTRGRGVGMFAVASVGVSVCNALTFEILDLESSFVVHRYVFRIFRSSSYIELIGSGQGHCVFCSGSKF